jgi:hypothetical protein
MFSATQDVTADAASVASPVSPGGRIEPVKQVHDIPVVEPHDLNAAKPKNPVRVTATNDPVAEAEPTPVLVPSAKDLAGLIASHERIRGVVHQSAFVAIDREDRIDIGWRWPTQG